MTEGKGWLRVIGLVEAKMFIVHCLSQESETE
jgi:hypothetical protein